MKVPRLQMSYVQHHNKRSNIHPTLHHVRHVWVKMEARHWFCSQKFISKLVLTFLRKRKKLLHVFYYYIFMFLKKLLLDSNFCVNSTKQFLVSLG